MNLKELINHVTEGYGIFGTYLIGTELGTFGNLPTIPDGYMFYKVDCDEDVENVKNMMKIENEEIDELYPNADDEIHLSLDGYESRCFLTALLFENVFNYWCGKNTKIKYETNDKSKLSKYDIFVMELWDWVRDELSTDELKKYALNFKKVVME